jgi:hypothetical protein
MKFKVVITYDSEYGGYIVDVPELVGCMSQGKTIDEALNYQGMVVCREQPRKIRYSRRKRNVSR